MLSSLQKINESLIYESVFNNNSIGVIVVNSKGLIEFTNPYAACLLGYEEEELHGLCIEQLVPERYRNIHIKHRKNYQHSLRQNHKMGGWRDLYALTKAGDELSVEISIDPCWLKGDIGNIVFLNDITKRKKIEKDMLQKKSELEVAVSDSKNQVVHINNKLEWSNEVLGKTLAYQNALFDNVGVMIIVTNEKGMIELINPEALMRLGYSEEEVVQKATPLLFHDEDELEEKRRSMFFESGLILPANHHVIITNVKNNIHKEAEYTYITKNGDRIPVSLTVTGIRNKQGEIEGYIYVAVDISERKTANEALSKALHKEKELNQLQSRFISLASHEFRTPLCTILSSAFLLQDAINGKGLTDLEAYLWRIKSAAVLLTSILENFMQADKLYECKTIAKPDQLNLIELIHPVVDEICSTTKRQIRYKHTGTTDVCIDAILLVQVVKGLLSNAVKYSAVDTLIEISTATDENMLKMVVKDRGIGILPEDQKNLMKRFFKGMNSGNTPGVGLGLHLVLKYTEMMNGTIEYVSEPEKGTEFILRFENIKGSYEKNSSC